MEQGVISLLEAQRATIKREWTRFLSAEPAPTALGNPDTLVFMMDETLNQLSRRVRSHLQRTILAGAESPPSPLQRRCACGMNPLPTYFVTGELALRAATAAALGKHFEPVLVLLRDIARLEIDVLCSVCPRRDTPSQVAEGL